MTLGIGIMVKRYKCCNHVEEVILVRWTDSGQRPTSIQNSSSRSTGSLEPRPHLLMEGQRRLNVRIPPWPRHELSKLAERERQWIEQFRLRARARALARTRVRDN